MSAANTITPSATKYLILCCKLLRVNEKAMDNIDGPSAVSMKQICHTSAQNSTILTNELTFRQGRQPPP